MRSFIDCPRGLLMDSHLAQDANGVFSWGIVTGNNMIVNTLKAGKFCKEAHCSSRIVCSNWQLKSLWCALLLICLRIRACSRRQCGRLPNRRAKPTIHDKAGTARNCLEDQRPIIN
eukprot:TRINITY_DN19646_c0_g1_i1.p1 TRINITY_DN19646_c0_g1~~TRINITY_DN19646_c0_g1_i1.p1  ORF type:complete len:116 (-),score=3.10 TRINITY_DN19646_c0_g1_i1:402-749(-)